MTDPMVVCYGEVGVDNIIQLPFLPTPEQAAFPTQDTHHIGGAAANTAAWLAAWDVPIRLVGNAIGQDEFGRSLLGWLEAWPTLDTSRLNVVDSQATPFCRIMVTPDGERTILVYGYPQSPVTKMTTGILGNAHFLAIDLYGGEERIEAARVGFEAEAVTLVNDVVEVHHPVLPFSRIVINSGAFIRSSMPGADLEEHARQIQGVSDAIVIITDGPNPVLVFESHTSKFEVAPPRVEARDTTGAGDAFRAGLIYGLLEDKPLQQAVAFGVAAGAEKVKRVGGGTDPASMQAIDAVVASLRPSPEGD